MKRILKLIYSTPFVVIGLTAALVYCGCVAAVTFKFSSAKHCWRDM
jgi:hypothetical protein